MGFILKSTIVYAQNKNLLKVFLLILAVTVPLSKILGAQSTLTHYTTFWLFSAIIFMMYLIGMAIGKFSDATFNPQIFYNDFTPVKYTDLPSIPNADRLYEFMNKSDKMYAKGAARLHDSVLNDYELDKYGNKTH